MIVFREWLCCYYGIRLDESRVGNGVQLKDI